LEVIDMRAHQRFITARGSGRVLALAVVASLVALSACAGVENLSGAGNGGGTGGGGGSGGVIGGGGGGSQSSVLLGSWTRALLVEGPNGDIHESRTNWEFRADGSAIRQVIAWNWTTGYYDTLSSVAQWSTTGANITITYIAGSSGTLTLAWRVDGDVLTLGPDQFARVR
jgi:hypothetical protein